MQENGQVWRGHDNAMYGTKLSKYCGKSCSAKGAEMVEIKKEEPQIETIIAKKL